MRLGEIQRTPTEQPDLVGEAESNTAESGKIVNTLRSAGYKQIGDGLDATVWAKKDSSQVLKIIMPEGSGITGAALAFKTFVGFCLDHQDIDCLPKFIPVENEYFKEFTIGRKKYIQVFMEKLYPIKRNTIQEGMVWMLSSYATHRDTPWAKVKKDLSEYRTWAKPGPFVDYAKRFAYKIATMSAAEDRRYQQLYDVMKILYKIGRVNKMDWDIHTGNVMQRADGSLVITDPWFMATTESLNEVRIDNDHGIGQTPYNASIDYHGLRVYMTPKTFLSLSPPLTMDDEDKKIIEYLKTKKDDPGFGAPYLEIEIPDQWGNGDFKQPAQIVDHDGRHRMMAILGTEGNAPVETHLRALYLRNRNFTAAVIQHLNQHIVSQNKKLVKGPWFSLTPPMLNEVTSTGDYHLWGGRVRVKNADFDNAVDVAVWAKTAFMAQTLLRAQYGKNAVITNVKKVA